MRSSRSASLAATNSGARIAHHVLIETRQQTVEQGAVAQHEAAFEQGRADGHVGLGLPQAFLDRARRVADLLLEIPKQVKHGFDDRFVAGAVLAAQQEQAGRCRSRAPARRGHSRRRRQCTGAPDCRSGWMNFTTQEWMARDELVFDDRRDARAQARPEPLASRRGPRRRPALVRGAPQRKRRPRLCGIPTLPAPYASGQSGRLPASSAARSISAFMGKVEARPGPFWSRLRFRGGRDCLAARSSCRPPEHA